MRAALPGRGSILRRKDDGQTDRGGDEEGGASKNLYKTKQGHVREQPSMVIRNEKQITGTTRKLRQRVQIPIHTVSYTAYLLFNLGDTTV